MFENTTPEHGAALDVVIRGNELIKQAGKPVANLVLVPDALCGYGSGHIMQMLAVGRPRVLKVVADECLVVDCELPCACDESSR